MEVALRDENNKIIAVKIVSAKFEQAEKLLFMIDNLLLESEVQLNKIKKIIVENKGGSFTALRIGIISANTLGYALNIPVEGSFKPKEQGKQGKFNIIEPLYNKEPNISVKK